MCEHCEPNDAGNMAWIRDEPDNSAWLEEYSDGWALITSVTTTCCGRECGTETYVSVSHCPMCGRELEVKVVGHG